MTTGTALSKYDTARSALEKAVRVDEVKEIRDRSIALQTYARQAKDMEMLEWVTEIRIRAERRTGELLREMEKQHGARGKPGPGRGKKTDYSSDESVLSIKDLGISHNESSLWQKLAAIEEKEFEKRLTCAIADISIPTTKKIVNPASASPPETSKTRPFDLCRAWSMLEEDLKKHRDKWPWEQRSELARILREFADGVMVTKKEYMR